MKKSTIISIASIAIGIIGSILASKQQQIEISEQIDARLALPEKTDSEEN